MTKHGGGSASTSRDAWIEKARAVPIESLVSHLKLRRVGAELVGGCPRCGDGGKGPRSDRFAVHPHKGIFCCRQCHAAGDVIALMMLLRGCGFKEAVEILAGSAPVQTRPQRKDDGDTDRRRQDKARWLWRSAVRAADTIVSDYLERRGVRLARMPRTIRYLPRNGDYPDAMIAAFGMAHEVEPGVVDIADDAVMGVHITRLLRDGSDRERGDKAKITVGTGFVAPIVLAPPNDLMGLAIAEGIEKGLALHAATGLGVWVAGCADRMPALAGLVPSYIECITVVVDDDATGRRNSDDLARRLKQARGFEVLVRGAPK
jgi:hypothetical protein